MPPSTPKTTQDEFIQIGNWTVKKSHQLGQGSYGTVFKARHRITNIPSAVKAIKYNTAEEKIKAEQELNIKSISHPNIVCFYDSVENNGLLYIFMEIIEGGELLQYVIKRKKLLEDEAGRIFFQILQALNHLHSNHIVHRDIKLENILITEDGIIKLIDFGFSYRIRSEDEKLSTLCGSPQYASPEICLGRDYDGRAVDIWALGVVLFGMVLGRLPFSKWNKEPAHILARHIVQADYVLPRDVLNPHLADLLASMLCVNPKSRITLPQILSHPWVVNFASSYPYSSSNLMTAPPSPSTSTSSCSSSTTCSSTILNTSRVSPDMMTFRKNETAHTSSQLQNSLVQRKTVGADCSKPMISSPVLEISSPRKRPIVEIVSVPPTTNAIQQQTVTTTTTTATNITSVQLVPPVRPSLPPPPLPATSVMNPKENQTPMEQDTERMEEKKFTTKTVQTQTQQDSDLMISSKSSSCCTIETGNDDSTLITGDQLVLMNKLQNVAAVKAETNQVQQPIEGRRYSIAAANDQSTQIVIPEKKYKIQSVVFPPGFENYHYQRKVPKTLNSIRNFFKKLAAVN